MGGKVGKIFKKQLEDTGVKFRMNASVESAEPSASDPTHVGAITLKGGERLEADLVILGVGVTPTTGYFKNSGIELEKDGSVRVDDYWRIKGLDDSYAVGQLASIEFHRVRKYISNTNTPQAISQPTLTTVLVPPQTAMYALSTGTLLRMQAAK